MFFFQWTQNSNILHLISNKNQSFSTNWTFSYVYVRTMDLAKELVHNIIAKVIEHETDELDDSSASHVI